MLGWLTAGEGPDEEFQRIFRDDQDRAAVRGWGGHLLVETSARQAARMAGLAAGHGLVPRVVSSPELAATVIIARRAGRQSGGRAGR